MQMSQQTFPKQLGHKLQVWSLKAVVKPANSQPWTQSEAVFLDMCDPSMNEL